jgi:hypothetical protein
MADELGQPLLALDPVVAAEERQAALQAMSAADRRALLKQDAAEKREQQNREAAAKRVAAEERFFAAMQDVDSEAASLDLLPAQRRNAVDETVLIFLLEEGLITGINGETIRVVELFVSTCIGPTRKEDDARKLYSAMSGFPRFHERWRADGVTTRRVAWRDCAAPALTAEVCLCFHCHYAHMVRRYGVQPWAVLCENDQIYKSLTAGRRPGAKATDPLKFVAFGIAFALFDLLLCGLPSCQGFNPWEAWVPPCIGPSSCCRPCSLAATIRDDQMRTRNEEHGELRCIDMVHHTNPMVCASRARCTNANHVPQTDAKRVAAIKQRQQRAATSAAAPDIEIVL